MGLEIFQIHCIKSKVSVSYVLYSFKGSEFSHHAIHYGVPAIPVVSGYQEPVVEEAVFLDCICIITILFK